MDSEIYPRKVRTCRMEVMEHDKFNSKDQTAFIFIEQIPCFGHDLKHFICIDLLNHCNNPEMYHYCLPLKDKLKDRKFKGLASTPTAVKSCFRSLTAQLQSSH